MFCPNCGKEYSENQNFCRYCGESLKENNEKTETPITDNKELENSSELQQEQLSDGGQNRDYHIDLITSSCETHVINEDRADTASESENSDDAVQREKQVVQDEHQTNFEEISENDEYKKYKRELLQNRENYLDKQVAEKRTVEFEKQQKKISPKLVLGVAVLVIIMAAFGNLLWSIDVETQITPTETGEAPELNLPSEDESTYSQEPEKAVQEEPIVEESKAEGLYADKIEDNQEENKVKEGKPSENQTAKQEKEKVEQVKEEKRVPMPAEPPIPPMPRVQEPSLDFSPTVE
ncbi:MAG: zinc ribbon domain-containing protein [Candidatus Gastranaerophilaceae bacterium]